MSNDAHPAQSEAPTANCTPHDDQETVLYQYAVCPFCCKVKAVMDYYKVIPSIQHLGMVALQPVHITENNSHTRYSNGLHQQSAVGRFG